YSPLTTAPSAVVVDPIGVRQMPASSETSCRATLGKNAALLALTTARESLTCRDQALEGGPSFCGPPVPDMEGRIAAARAKLFDAASTCGSSPAVGSPGALGYAICPSPCNSIQFTCAAGNVGAPCTSDAQCDSPPGAGNGSCGQWTMVGNCLACV